MAVTLLPVSAITAWAEGGDQLRIVDGYPVGSGGEGWSYDGTTLDLHPASSTEYDFLSIISGNGNVTKCKLTIGGNATIVRGNFDNTVINNGKISGGYFYSSSPLTNHGTIIDGLFVSAVSNESEGKIENGTFRSTVTNSGTIKSGIFSEKPSVFSIDLLVDSADLLYKLSDLDIPKCVLAIFGKVQRIMPSTTTITPKPCINLFLDIFMII